MNNVGDASVLAMFNAETEDRNLSVTVTYDDIKVKNADEYIAYAYFKKKFYRVTKDTCLKFDLKKTGVEILNFYPIRDNCIMLGDTTKYISAACDTISTKVTDIQLDLV